MIDNPISVSLNVYLSFCFSARFHEVCYLLPGSANSVERSKSYAWSSVDG